MKSNLFPRLMTLSLVLAMVAVPLARGEEPARPAVGSKAADFTLDDLSGKSISLSDTLKNGPVVLVVLRGWPGYQCPFCTKQVAELRSHASEFKAADTTVLMVYPGPSPQLKVHAEEFFKDKAFTDQFRLLIDPDFKFTKAYGLRWNASKETAYPSTFVIDRDSFVRYARISKGHGDRANSAEILKALADLK